MKKKSLMQAGKWVAIVLLISCNYISYLVYNKIINLVLAILIIAYSIYDFFHTLTILKLNKGIKIYLFSFFLLALLSLFFGIYSLLTNNFKYAAVSLFFIAGDAALILYIVHKVKNINY